MGDTRGTGCGIYPLILKNTKFYPACEWHDKAYTEGSWQQANFSRADMDAWFLKQMLELSDSFLDRIRARLFYFISVSVGRGYWEGKK